MTNTSMIWLQIDKKLTIIIISFVNESNRSGKTTPNKAIVFQFRHEYYRSLNPITICV